MQNKHKQILKNPLLIIPSLGHRGFFNWMSDEAYLRLVFRIKMGKSLNLSNPQSFNEKLQWLKLNDRRPEYTMMVDKYAVKEYVEGIIGEEHIIPTLGVWNRFDDIDFNSLPNQFVLKCTHDSGGLIIVKDKSNLDIAKARKKINHCLKHNYYWGLREWPYKDMKPRIIAEQFMVDESGTDLKDYKFFCFNGEMKFFKIDFDRYTDHHANYYDPTGEIMPFGEAQYPPTPKKQLVIPKELPQMIALSEKLSRGIPFLRVDFYNINGMIFFGELTFFPASGIGKFTPEEWDNTLGSWLDLSKVKIK